MLETLQQVLESVQKGKDSVVEEDREEDGRMMEGALGVSDRIPQPEEQDSAPVTFILHRASHVDNWLCEWKCYYESLRITYVARLEKTVTQYFPPLVVSAPRGPTP